MLKQEQPVLDLYSDFYDKIIPKDNLLRQIKEMELQAALTMFAVNLKRIFKLLEEK